MVIGTFSFPIYGTFILLSLFIGIIFNYIFLRKNKIEKNYIFLFSLMIVSFSIIGGILINSLLSSNKDLSLTNIGLTSYGGAVGVISAAIIFEKICPKNGVFIKGAIISLPLIYSISKLACFFAGCCYGLPCNSFFCVRYTAGLNIPLVPIQLIETIMFMLVFISCVYIQKNKNVVAITIILSAFTKFVLDFLRFNHLKEIISQNQIISVMFMIIGIVILVKNNKKKEISNGK